MKSIDCAVRLNLRAHVTLSALLPIVYCRIICTASGDCRKMTRISACAGALSNAHFRAACPPPRSRRVKWPSAKKIYDSGGFGNIKSAMKRICSATWNEACYRGIGQAPGSRVMLPRLVKSNEFARGHKVRAHPAAYKVRNNSSDDTIVANSGNIFSISMRCSSGSGLAQQSSITFTCSPASSA